MIKGIRSLFKDEVLSTNKGLALLMFIILYTSFDTLVFGTLDMPILRTIHDVMHIAACLLCILIIVIKGTKFTPLIIISILILLSCLANHDFSGGNFLLIIVFVISYCIASTLPLKRFLVVYEHLFFYLVLINLLLYFTYNINSSLFSLFPTWNNVIGDNYRIAFFTVFQEGDYVHLRNMGFFREPGVYMMYLNLALIINFFFYKEPNYRNVIIYIITMITTLSTAGYVIIFAILFTYFGIKKSKTGIIVISLFFIAFVFSYNYIKDLDIFLNTLGKFSTSSDKYASAEARYASTTAPLYMIFHYPIFGTGLEGFTSEFLSFSLRRYHLAYSREGGATNTLLNLGAIYGLIMLLVMLKYLWCFAKKIQIRKSWVITISLFAIFFLILSNEEVYHTVFFMTLIMYGATKQIPYYK